MTDHDPAPGSGEEAAPHGVVDIAGWLREGWEIARREPLVFALVTAIYIVLLVIVGHVPLGNLLIAGPLTIGFYLVVADMALGREFNVWRLFEGFRFFLPALAAYLAITFFTLIGFVLLIIPGLIVSAWYLFAFPLIADRRLGFWQAMAESRRVVRQDTIGFVFFFLAMVAVNILGLLCLGIGLLISLPVTYAATFAAYRKLMGLQALAETPAPAPVQI